MESLKNKDDKDAKLEKLEKLFDSQIKTLEERVGPGGVLRELRTYKRDVCLKASQMSIPEGHIPFIPVVLQYSIFDFLMPMVWNGNKKGKTNWIRKEDIRNIVFDSYEDKTPYVGHPYYIFDVEDGKALRGQSPSIAEYVIAQNQRSPLTVTEIISLCIHSDVLSRHFVYAIGSNCGRWYIIPEIHLGENGVPILDSVHSDFSCDNWGSPSCGSRISLEFWPKFGPPLI
jgi:hypothetical protein